MKRLKSPYPVYLQPIPTAILIILLGAAVAVTASHSEKGMLQMALQSVASVPGLGWVANWINPSTDSSLSPIGTNGIPASRLSQTTTNSSSLVAGDPLSHQTISSSPSSSLDTLTPLPGALSNEPTVTGTLPDDSATLTPLPVESPTSTPAEDTTPTPSGTVQATLTPTPTELPDTRHLSLSSAEVMPGDKFQIHLYCDNTEGIAGCDVGLEFEPGMLDLITVHKTDITDPFLLVKRKGAGTFILSLAGLDGLGVGNGVLLTFEGAVSSSMAQGQQAMVGFIKAKLYNTESKAFEVRTTNGMIQIKSDPASTPTEIAQSTPSPDGVSTPVPGTATEENPTPVPETTPSDPSVAATLPPASVGGGYPARLVPTNSATLSPTPTGPPPTSLPLDMATPTPTRLRADLNKDGEVNALDLMEFMRNWQLVFPEN